MLPHLLFGQADVAPQSLDFGTLGNALVGITYERVVEVRNTSAGPIIVRPLRTAPDYVPDVLRIETSLVGYNGKAAARLAPGQSVSVVYRLSLEGWGPQPFLLHTDTLFIGVRPETDPEASERLRAVPVRAQVAEMDEPVLEVQKGNRYAQCACDFDGRDPLPIGGARFFYLVNPMGSRDTMTLDSMTVIPLGNSIVNTGWINSVYTYDTIAPPDPVTGRPPEYSSRLFPVAILPGMTALVPVWQRNPVIGDHRTAVRFFLHDGRGREWVRQDTFRLLVEAQGDPLEFAPNLDVFVVSRWTDTARDLAQVYYTKCGVPDSVPLWLDRTYFRGPRADAIEFNRMKGSATLLTLPRRVECAGLVGYDVWIYRERAGEGETIDTLVAEYHYDDPVRGRVDTVAERTVVIRVVPRPTLSVSAGAGREGEELLREVPNPARDRLRLALTAPLVEPGTVVRLFDVLGREVPAPPVLLGPSGVADLDVSGLPPGTYRVVVETGEGPPAAVRDVIIRK